MIRDDEFLEHAEVFGHLYGTARRFLREAEQKGHNLLLDIDVQGARQVKQRLPDAISIFILPPDRKTLEWRLRKRSEDTEDVIQRRLVTATREIENYDKYNYILVNDQLQDSIESVRSARLCRSGRTFSEDESKVLELAERCRLANIRDRVQPILASFAASAVSGGTQ
jgi:guanylate kinase